MATPSAEAREVVRAAARWLALLESGQASQAELQRLAQWRASNSQHENAWQKAQLLRQRFSQLPSELAMATLDRPDASRRALLKQALAVAALVPTAYLLGRQLPLDAWTADVRTAVGERRKLVLSDGTTLQLNTDSAVDIDLLDRRVKLLRGEVAVSVPGTINLALQAPYGQVQVSGAEVCVRLFDQACRVSVVKGSATLQPLRSNPMVLQAGQQASLGASGAGPIVAVDDLLLGWREGVLRLDDRPLGDLLHELRRYRPGLLRWAPELERLRVTGTFRLDDTDRLLALLAASLPLEVQARTRYWVTLVPRENRA
jgi:transmembrane sensor